MKLDIITFTRAEAEQRLQSCSNDVVVPSDSVAKVTKTETVDANVVDTALYNSITSTDQVFVLRDNAVFEYNNKTGKLTETDYCIIAPDYYGIVNKKIQEICAGIHYESSRKGDSFKTERYVFDAVIKAKLIDILKRDVVVSSLDVKEIIKFLINVNADIIEVLKKSLGMEGIHPDLDVPTVCIIAIKAILDSDNKEEAAKLKKVLLITDLIMKQIDKMKSAVKPATDSKDPAKPNPDTNTKTDEKKEPAKKEDNKKGSSK